MTRDPRTDADPPEAQRVTQLFDLYVQAREGRRTVDREDLLRHAGEAAAELEARIRAYEQVQRLASEFGALEEDAPPPTHIGRFEILNVLGEGGLGRVYLARDPGLSRIVALKVLDPEQGIGPRERGFVLNEARALARLEHPGVVRVFEVGDPRAGGPAHIVMEHLDGPTLAEVVAELRRLRSRADGARGAREGTATGRIALELEPYTARVRCLARLAEALAYCHDRGVLHRDIKPSNVIFDAKGRPKLVDFGLAHHAERGEEARIDVTGRLYATPAYAAPEQIESGRTGADPRSDLFSLGTLAYELLALGTPFARKTRHLTLESVRQAEAPPLARRAPGLPSDLVRAVHHCLERDPERRYPSVAAFAADLRAVLEHRPISVAPPSGAHRLGLWLRRRRRALVALALAALLAGTAGAAAQVSQTHSRGSRLASSLGELERRMARAAGLAQTHAELRAIGSELLGARAAALELDRGRTQRWLFGRALARVETAELRWSELLAAGIAADEERCAQEGVPFQAEAWKELLGLDERLGAGPASQRYGRRGGFELDPALALLGTPVLYAQVALGTGPLQGFQVYRPIEPVPQPVPGSYRVVVWDAEGRAVREQELYQRSGWDRFHSLRPHPPRPELLAAARRFERSARPLPPLPPPAAASDAAPGAASDGMPDDLPVEPRIESLVVPAFRLTEPIRADQYRAYREAVGRALPDAAGESSAFEQRAFVIWSEAAAFCEWAGGRLPSSLELAAAAAQGLVLAPPWPPAHAEWVVDLNPLSGTDQALAFKYSLFAAKPEEAPMGWSVSHARDAPLVAELAEDARARTGRMHVGTLFRVAFTDDERGAFESSPAFR